MILKDHLKITAAWCLDGEEIRDAELKAIAIETGQTDESESVYQPTLDTTCDELRSLVELERETLRRVTELEREVAPVMAPW